MSFFYELGSYLMKHIGRKFFHFLGGLGLLSLYYLLERRDALICYVAIALAVLAIDITRLRIAALNRFMQKRLSSFIRENESNKLTGTVPYVLGVGLSFFLYRADLATAAILFLACGDVMATTIGEYFGRTKIAGKKSLEGTVAFFVAAVLSGMMLNLLSNQLPFGILIFGALIAAGVELLPLPLNDNLVIPLVSGGVMELMVRMAVSV